MPGFDIQVYKSFFSKDSFKSNCKLCSYENGGGLFAQIGIKYLKKGKDKEFDKSLRELLDCSYTPFVFFHVPDYQRPQIHYILRTMPDLTVSYNVCPIGYGDVQHHLILLSKKAANGLFRHYKYERQARRIKPKKSNYKKETLLQKKAIKNAV